MARANPNGTPMPASTPCQANGCQRSSATICDHCNKRVCRFHFNEHAQSLTEELYELTSQIIQLDEEIKQLDLASLKKQTLEKLIEWHKQGIERLNTFYEEKKMEIDQALVNGRNYLCQTAEKLKEETNTLLQDNELSYNPLKTIENQLRKAQTNLMEMKDSENIVQLKPLSIDRHLFRINLLDDCYFNGGTLLSFLYQLKLNEFYGRKTQQWRLIYKGTRDGFTKKEFNCRCARYGPMMFIIQSKSNSGPGYLFGGFKNNDGWPTDYVDEVKYDRREFLFTLTNPHQIRPMIVEEGGKIHMFQEFQRYKTPMMYNTNYIGHIIIRPDPDKIAHSTFNFTPSISTTCLEDAGFVPFSNINQLSNRFQRGTGESESELETANAISCTEIDMDQAKLFTNSINFMVNEIEVYLAV